MFNAADNTKDNIDSMAQQTQQAVKDAQNQLQQSGKDWWDYVKEHPIHSMLFGVSLLYSIKGFVKEMKK